MAQKKTDGPVRAFYITHQLTTKRTHQPIGVGLVNVVAYPDKPVVMCRNGMHASRHVLDAMAYNSGANVTVVEVSGDVQELNRRGSRGTPKICGRERKTLAIVGGRQKAKVCKKLVLDFFNEAFKAGLCTERDYKLALRVMKLPPGQTLDRNTAMRVEVMGTPEYKFLLKCRKAANATNNKTAFKTAVANAYGRLSLDLLANALVFKGGVARARLNKLADAAFIKEAGL